MSAVSVLCTVETVLSVIQWKETFDMSNKWLIYSRGQNMSVCETEKTQRERERRICLSSMGGHLCIQGIRTSACGIEIC